MWKGYRKLIDCQCCVCLSDCLFIRLDDWLAVSGSIIGIIASKYNLFVLCFSKLRGIGRSNCTGSAFRIYFLERELEIKRTDFRVLSCNCPSESVLIGSFQVDGSLFHLTRWILENRSSLVYRRHLSDEWEPNCTAAIIISFLQATELTLAWCLLPSFAI